MPPKEKPGRAGGRIKPGLIPTSFPDSKYHVPQARSQGWREELAERLARCRGLGIDADLGNLNPADAFGLLIFLRGRP